MFVIIKYEYTNTYLKKTYFNWTHWHEIRLTVWCFKRTSCADNTDLINERRLKRLKVFSSYSKSPFLLQFRHTDVGEEQPEAQHHSINADAQQTLPEVWTTRNTGLIHQRLAVSKQKSKLGCTVTFSLMYLTEHGECACHKVMLTWLFFFGALKEESSDGLDQTICPACWQSR